MGVFPDVKAAINYDGTDHPSILGQYRENGIMTQQATTLVPRWFWIIGILSLIWNLMGGMIFISEVFAKEAMMKEFSEAQKEWSRAIPVWIYFVFGISVLSGLAGSITLLKRRRTAILFYVVSCVTVLVQMSYTMLIAGGLKVMGPSGAIMPAIVVILSITWLTAAKYSSQKGLLHPS